MTNRPLGDGMAVNELEHATPLPNWPQRRPVAANLKRDAARLAADATFLGLFEHLYEANFSGEASLGPTMLYSAIPSSRMRLHARHGWNSIRPPSGYRRDSPPGA